MKKDCTACHPKTSDALCSVHRRAYTMMDLLREIQDAYLERAAAVISKHSEPDPGRLPKAVQRIHALLAMIQADQSKGPD